MLAFYLHTLSPFLWEIRPGFGLRWYGLAYVLAFFCGYRLYHWLSEHGYSELPPDNVADFITWGAIFGVMLGGRLGQMLFYETSDFLHNPLVMFRIWENGKFVGFAGMSSHGGMIGLILFTLFYARKHKLSWTGIGDNLCVVAPIGLFFGRVANFINGELYGRIANHPWCVQFPSELYDNADLAEQVRQKFGMDDLGDIIAKVRHDPQAAEILRHYLPPRHPSQLYEAFLEGIVLFSALWFLRTKTRQPRGVLTGAFFLLYALLRIIGEYFREPESDSPFVFKFGLTYGQLLSLFFIALGVAFILYGYVTKRYERAQSQA
jgi:phosphatidylglycerol:prolipoprotein diacylglycerol transferase